MKRSRSLHTPHTHHILTNHRVAATCHRAFLTQIAMLLSPLIAKLFIVRRLVTRQLSRTGSLSSRYY